MNNTRQAKKVKKVVPIIHREFQTVEGKLIPTSTIASLEDGSWYKQGNDPLGNPLLHEVFRQASVSG
ncbi:hypothetical protein CYMTET_56237 [Cymbomonas tetramitiformis]|uniref:Uncharacterized protein n=1 Tax=Cymbomonas tetramitiformis TaxID=36881 RepID=A0AAE0BBP6_9CHLO|nr:hypothetical protein CYMTET_56237 [Cymbomonas tetramitiformis]